MSTDRLLPFGSRNAFANAGRLSVAQTTRQHSPGICSRRLHPTTICCGLSASPNFYKMKQVLIAKLKLVPTTELQNLLWDLSLVSQDVLDYASRMAWLIRSQLSCLIGEYISLVRRAVLSCHSLFFDPKLAISLTQEIGQAIHAISRKRRIPRRGRKGFSLQPFQESL